MKNVCLKVGLIALALALAFGVVLITLSIKKMYAVSHYEVNYKETPHYINGEVYHVTKGYGCGENDCKYCNGMGHRDSFDEFVYYRTIRGFWVASIVLTAVCGVVAGVAIPLHFKRESTRRSDREDY